MMQDDLSMIEELDHRDIEASKSQCYSTLIDLWTDDGVALPPGENPVIGKQALQTWLEGNRDTDYRITRYFHHFEERKIIGEWAFEWGTYDSAAEQVGGGESIEATGKLMRILKRQPDGRWKVARAIWNNDPRPSEFVRR